MARHLQAAESIGRRILSGELRPGTVLPSATDLAGAMALSRPAVREALKVLSGKGLLHSIPRRGTVVRPRAAWNCLDPDVLRWQQGDKPNAAFIRDLYQLRRSIEPEAAASAALRASAEVLADIESALNVMASVDVVSPASIKADVGFHQAILVASGNAFFMAFAPVIDTSLSAVFNLQRAACPVSEHFVPDHRAILDAIKRGDAEGVRNTVFKLLARAEADAMQSLKESSNS